MCPYRMGKLYKFLGISVAVVQEGHSQKRKREAFSADITYLTANALGFTFLQDTSSVDRKEDLVCARFSRDPSPCSTAGIKDPYF